MKFIKDEEFIRGNCPMTKEVIRMIDVCSMDIDKDSKVLDVGAGTGSISIQCAKICSDGYVTAIEKEDEALQVIYKNIDKFNIKNLKVIKGDAAIIESKIEDKFDSIFIGGSSGQLVEIITKYSKKLTKNGNMVLNFITLENLYKALETLKNMDYIVECEQIAVNKTVGNTYMIKANNPIFILKAKKKIEEI